MKLSEIIAYKNLLDASTPLEATPIAHDKLNPILNIVKEHPVQLSNQTTKLIQDYRYVLRMVDEFEQTIENLKVELQDLIDKKSDSYYTNCSQNYSQSAGHETPEYILNRRLPIFSEITEQLVTRIRSHNDWHHAGMIIRPGHEDWITDLVGCDPLYLVDQNTELLQPAILRFNDQYKRKLRLCVIEESADYPIFSGLPDNQFGFCLIYNFFNYRPIEVIEIYLKELYTKLKPGGSIGMTINDCDRAGGAETFERHFMSFTPLRAVIKMIESIGYRITYNFRTDESNTWLEIQRPGKLKSLRGGQAVAKISDCPEKVAKRQREEKLFADAKDLNIPNYKDLSLENLEQVIDIRQKLFSAAGELNIPSYNKLTNMQLEEQITITEKIRSEAKNLNIADWNVLPIEQLPPLIQDANDLLELFALRKKAVRLHLDKTELIMSVRHYPLERLRELINQWRKTQ
jgi:hypothetical protein